MTLQANNCHNSTTYCTQKGLLAAHPSYCYLSDGLIVELKCGEEDKDGVLQLGVKGLVGQLPVHKDAEGGEGDTSGQPVRLLLARLQQHTNNLVLNTHTHK